MSRVEKFEDLIAWQKARSLARKVYQITRAGSFVRDTGLGRQMQRAAVSIMSNIAEGFERGGRAEFHQFLSIAKASCAEVRSQMYVALDAGHIDRSCFEELMPAAEETARIIGGLRVSVAQQRDAQRRRG